MGRVMCLCALGLTACLLASRSAAAQTTDDALFIHHSVGNRWLEDGLHDALLDKDYIDERTDIYYGVVVSPDAGRSASLGSVAGDNTDMEHWVFWFNDYFESMLAHGCADGSNRIVLFKSCYPTSNVWNVGTEPGDPFASATKITNYKAVYRHPSGSGNVYENGGYTYKPLEDVFAEHPEVLFIPITAPPLHYAPSDGTNDGNGHRIRTFNNWLVNEWLPAYVTRTGLHNVAVFDFFDILAYPDDHPTLPNRLRQEYGGDSGDSHPNSVGNAAATLAFATGADNFLDAAWDTFTQVEDPDRDGDGLPNDWEETYSLGPDDPTGDNGASGDPDDDHWTNIREFEAGTSPRDPLDFPEPPLGDVNGSGQVDATDVQLVINAALGLDSGLDCDLDGSGAVDAVDVQIVINSALGLL